MVEGETAPVSPGVVLTQRQVTRRVWMLRAAFLSVAVVSLAVSLYTHSQGWRPAYYLLHAAAILWLTMAGLVLSYRILRITDSAEGRQRAHLLKANMDLWRLAIRDDLTQLYNRRYFSDRLHDELAKAQFFQRPLALIIGDVDNLKAVNDNHGHKVGDLVLKNLADRLTQGTRLSDVVARFGGDEFAILMPQTGQEGAEVVVQRLRSLIEESPAWSDAASGKAIHISMSFGIAGYPWDSPDADDLMRRADQRLYEAKPTAAAVASPSRGRRG